MDSAWNAHGRVQPGFQFRRNAAGLQDDILFGPERWTTQMFYPLVHSKREHSALRPGGYGFTEADLQTEAKQEAA